MTMEDCMPAQRLATLLAALPDAPEATAYRRIVLRLLPFIQTHVPPMGEGRSAARLRFLSLVARRDLGLARLVEGHLDATQILREARRPVADDRLYGIWASGGPADTVEITANTEAGPVLTGCKPFCSGSDIVDLALVYVYPSDQLVEVDIREAARQGELYFEPGEWVSPAFAETHTWSVRFRGVPVSARARVGSRKWYFERPGFCLGALAPAACWAGGATGLADSVRQRKLKDGHARAHLGAMASTVCSMDAMLNWGAQQVDADPGNASGSQFPIALLVRHHIERGSTEIMDRFGRTLGPRPYAFEPVNARRIAELSLYIRQCHAERDLEELGTYLEAHPAFCSDGFET